MKAIATALLNAQNDFPAIPHDKTNPHFKSKYTSLDALINGTRKVLAKHGLVITQVMDESPAGTIAVVTLLLHGESGEQVMSKCVVPLDKSNAQAAGSAITYARRYGYAAILGIVSEEDDDGNAASKKRPDRQVDVGAWCKRNFPTKEGFEMFQSACKEKGKDWKTVARENPNANGAEIMELVESL